MLRLAVIALLLLNVGYYAWTQGAFNRFGLGPSDDSEPLRVQQQIAPEQLQIRPSGKPAAPASSAKADSQDAPVMTAAAPASPTGPVACWQVGTFETQQAQTLRTAAAQHLPEGSWTLEPTPIPGRWMVYMGRFADKEALAQKRNELRRLKIDSDRPSPQWEPGLSLGRFPTEEGAAQELEKLVRQGVRTARVVQERGDTPGYTLRLPQADAALRNKLRALGPALAGKQPRECEAG